MQVKRGTIYGFLGPNGSGKTTTIRMLCGLLTPDKGRGTCLGYDIRTETDKIKLHVGYMTQRFSLYQDLSVRENLEFVARLYDIADPVGAARGDGGAARPCKGREEQLAGSLSGGWKQRLALGACTLPNPQAAAARRADRRRRSEGAARILERDPCARGRRADRAGLHPLHGRGRALSRDRLHRLRRSCWCTAPCDEVIAQSHLATYVVSGEGLGELAARLERHARHRHGGAVRHQPACLGARRRGARSRDRAVSRTIRRSPGSASQPSLEDVFIDLMGRARDNFQDAAYGDVAHAHAVLAAHARDADQGVHPAQARPHVVRHDRS